MTKVEVTLVTASSWEGAAYSVEFLSISEKEWSEIEKRCPQVTMREAFEIATQGAVVVLDEEWEMGYVL